MLQNSIYESRQPGEPAGCPLPETGLLHGCMKHLGNGGSVAKSPLTAVLHWQVGSLPLSLQGSPYVQSLKLQGSDAAALQPSLHHAIVPSLCPDSAITSLLEP